jgi:hypothetical protein
VNTNAVAVVLVSALFCGLIGAGVSPQAGTNGTTTQPVSEGGFGGDVSVFMQRGVVAANGSVDSGMWTAAFESAENQSRKAALVAQRAATLRARLDRLETRIEALPVETNDSVTRRARRARLAADRDTLNTAISEAKTAAAGEGVNASKLDRLSRRMENLSVPAASNGSRQSLETVTEIDGLSAGGAPAVETTFYPSSTNNR